MFGYLSDKIRSFVGLFKNKKITRDVLQVFLGDLKHSLVDADISLDTVNAFLRLVEERCVGVELQGSVNPEEFITKHVHDSLVEFLSVQHGDKDLLKEFFDLSASSNSSYKTLLVAGLQGAGKTTSIGKLLFHFCYLHKDVDPDLKKKILVCSVDFQRAAAQDQLKVLCEKLEISYIAPRGTSVEGHLSDVHEYAIQNSYKYIFLDTAGRTHVDAEALDELKIISKKTNPDSKLLVLDGMMRQLSFDVVNKFSKIVDFDGALITKMDSQSRGGVAFSFSYATSKPLFYIGTGEGIEDLERFRPVRVARTILGMGDIETILDRVNKKIAKEEELLLEKAMKSGDLTIDGYVAAFDMLEKLGSFKSVLSMMPQSLMPGKISDNDIAVLEDSTRMFRIIRNSMTAQERKYPQLLGSRSRVMRISRGSGVSTNHIEVLLKQYNQSKKQIKQFNKMRHLFKF